MFSDILTTLKSLLPTKKSPTAPYSSSSPPKPPPKPITTVIDTRWERFKHPSGVHPRHAIIVCYLGRIGFVAKGIVYAVMGGLCISTAQHMGADLDGVESPLGAFIFLGLSEIGTPLLVIMFIGLLSYSSWRFWEGGLGQGSDATRSAPSNFFRYRLSPCVSGAVYVAYLSYIGEVLSDPKEQRSQAASSSSNCFPACWATGALWQRAVIGIAGLAFIIAFITQIQNGFSNRWHRDLMIHHCTSVEKYVILLLGHLGFLSRAGVFMFVAVFMFRTLVNKTTTQQKDTFSDAINQIIGVHGGQVGLWFLGIGLILFGIFAAANAYYKYYPTPPPSRYTFPSKQQIRSQQQQNPQNNDGNHNSNSNNNSDEDAIASLKLKEEAPKLVTSITCPTLSIFDDGNTIEDTDHQHTTSPRPNQSTTGMVNGSTPLEPTSSIDNGNQGSINNNTNNNYSMDSFDTNDNAPPSPFEETRRFRWQQKRLQQTNNIA
ncbi:hypothetical protein BC941DRAFT_514439 [Chlamydoabsidia padenii]|nr:hypothetical protein BC941DRAFT_514439 [Chlamydoabsidia padenii]